MKIVTLTAQEQKQLYALRVIWFITGVALLLGFGWMFLAGWSIDWSTFCMRFLVLAVGMPLAMWCRYREVDINVCVFVHMQMQMVFFTTALVTLSYVSASVNLPLMDDRLIAADRWLGFDWLSYVHWLNRYPALAEIMSIIYGTMLPQMLMLPVLLFLCRKGDLLIQYLWVFIISGMITLIIGMLMPALGGYYYYHPSLADYPNIEKYSPFLDSDDFLTLRDGTQRLYDAQTQGIVTFPSFHAVLAVLFMYVLWAFPLLFPLGVILNILMIISALCDGAHYLSDVLAGSVIALLSILLARRIFPAQSVSAANAG